MNSLTAVDGRIDLWHVDPDAVADAHLLDRYRELLSADEQARHERLLRSSDRHRFLVTRAMVRCVLSAYGGGDPRQWVFEHNAYGKPSIARPGTVRSMVAAPLCFNVSHTAGMVVCAATAGREIGVDVEHLDRARLNLRLADRYFAPSEAGALRRLPTDEQPRMFLRLWTLKEAYIKARAMGLSIPLDAFAFTLQPDRPPAISFTQKCADRVEDWQFAQIEMGCRHQIALAVQTSARRDVIVTVREIVPLGTIGPQQMLPNNPARDWRL